MSKHKPFFKNHIFLFLIIIGSCLLWLPKAIKGTYSATGTPHKVHIAFGFHVNLYHSFRGDTNDENGFGQDVRVIRHIISELDRFNRKGIPVSAVWDFDNLFSLQEILPAYAPDIIHDVQRRVRENKDDVILMSYNNGLMSAMNHQEFMVSMQRAQSNKQGSGLQDLFERVVPVVRPQEMMTTPGNFERYRDLGIQYLSLYYSATPFDAFRLFSRELTPTEAYNPVNYRNPVSGEHIVIIPTYHVGDLVEHVSLRNWAEKLHRLQNEGKIDRDVLIFINFDADAEYWTGVDLPWHLNWLPNTGGLGQLVDSVSDLNFVSFSSLTDYLSTHSPTGTIHFSQDTADGSFHGYNSWAEKSYASDYWTRILRNRLAHLTAQKVGEILGEDSLPEEFHNLAHKSFETRLRALSTTNFGLASPFLTWQREAAMASLLDRLDSYTDQINKHIGIGVDTILAKADPTFLDSNQERWVDTFLLLSRDTDKNQYRNRNLVLTLPIQKSDGNQYFFLDTDGHVIPTIVVKRLLQPDKRYVSMTFHVPKHHDMPDGLYFLMRQTNDATNPAEPFQTISATPRILRNEFITVHFDEQGHMSRVIQDGIAQLDAKSMLPYINYDGKRLSPKQLNVTVEETGLNGVAAVRIHGRWEGPPEDTRAPGWVNYRFWLISGIPYLFIDGELRYPDTYRHKMIQPEKPMLARKIDAGWKEVAPIELRFSPRARKEHPFLIHKRNYLGKEDAYAVDYYRHSPKNLNVSSINNHITSEYVGVTNDERGMAIAMNTSVNANFAFCPFKMEYLQESDEFVIRANPFGTYHGDQILPSTQGNRLGYEAVLLSAPQLYSAGPTYNGYNDRFELMISFFEGDTIPDHVKRDLISFARQPMALGKSKTDNPRKRSPAILTPAGFLALPYQDGVLFHWEKVGGGNTRYRIRYRDMVGSVEKSLTTTDSMLFIEASEFSKSGGTYVATIEAILPDDRLSQQSPEISFRLTQKTEHSLDIPNNFKARILWANVNAWIRRNLL